MLLSTLDREDHYRMGSRLYSNVVINILDRWLRLDQSRGRLVNIAGIYLTRPLLNVSLTELYGLANIAKLCRLMDFWSIDWERIWNDRLAWSSLNVLKNRLYSLFTYTYIVRWTKDRNVKAADETILNLQTRDIIDIYCWREPLRKGNLLGAVSYQMWHNFHEVIWTLIYH